jgi:sugar phosphate isomerase/epimerase
VSPAFFYNTNGFAFHRLEDAVAILADLGYDGVAWTPDVHHLDPLRSDAEAVAAFRRHLDRRGMRLVVETGARFVLDPLRKHRPTLLDDPPLAARRLELLRRCADLAADLGAPVVSTWSGTAAEGVSPETALDRLVAGLRALCEHAARRGVRVGFEPEPGMAIETVARWPEVRDRVGHEALGLTLDVGHCLATRECDPADAVERHAREILVLQVDDHRRGVHEHLAFGDGEVDFRRLAAAVRASGYVGPVEVELSRHSANAPETARRSIGLLREIFTG